MTDTLTLGALIELLSLLVGVFALGFALGRDNGRK
jgi:hypothetical protein